MRTLLDTFVQSQATSDSKSEDSHKLDSISEVDVDDILRMPPGKERTTALEQRMHDQSVRSV